MGVDTQAQSQSGNTVIRGIAPFIHDKLIINNVEKMHEIMKENQLKSFYRNSERSLIVLIWNRNFTVCDLISMGSKKTCGLDEIMRCLHWVLNGDAPTKT